MNNMTPNKHYAANGKVNWSAGEVVSSEEEEQDGFLQRWYAITTPPEPPASASFVKRETARRMRLVSTICLFFGLALIPAIPATFYIPNHIAVVTTTMMFVIAIVALILNRYQWSLVAGSLLVIGLELSIMLAIITTRPLDEPSLQYYDLFVLCELLAVSVLPVRSVFIVCMVNIVFTTVSFSILPLNPALKADIQVQEIGILVKPLAAYVIAAFISYLWVVSATKSAARADRAEMVANLEHALAEQKRDLEEGIEKILQTHVAVANGNLNARAPLTQDSTLWQIARALNTLLVRFQRSALAEKELQHVEHAISSTVHTVQYAEQHHQPLRLTMTQSMVDSLLVALHGKTIMGIQPSSRTHTFLEPGYQPNTPYPQNIPSEKSVK